jgi:hypothetical protein
MSADDRGVVAERDDEVGRPGTLIGRSPSLIAMIARS